MEPLPSACEPAPARTPQTIVWFRVYAAVMTGLYALCVLAAPLVFLAGARRMGGAGSLLKIQVGVLLLMGLVFALAFALALVLPRKPWGWIYGLALMPFGNLEMLYLQALRACTYMRYGALHYGCEAKQHPPRVKAMDFPVPLSNSYRRRSWTKSADISARRAGAPRGCLSANGCTPWYFI